MARDRHPPCPCCDSPMFKAFRTGVRSKKSEPYRFCRNSKCEKSGARGVVSRRASKESGKEVATTKRAPSRSRKRRATLGNLKGRVPLRDEAAPATEPRPAPPAKPADPLGDTRVAIKGRIAELAGDATPQQVALILAIALQETGNSETAIVLIAKHNLGSLGLKNLP